MRRMVGVLTGGLAASALAISPAAAHHVMDGKVPSTLLQGVLSGFGHPVIGPDHLAFILAVGIASAIVPAGFGLIAAFVAASTAGVLVHLGAVNLPFNEVLVACSVVIAGGLVAMGRRQGSGSWLLLAAVAGLFHGYAFGEAIVGAERAVLGAYLAGLGAVACLIAVAAGAVTRVVADRVREADWAFRLAGGVLGCVGLVLMAASLVQQA